MLVLLLDISDHLLLRPSEWVVGGGITAEGMARTTDHTRGKHRVLRVASAINGSNRVVRGAQANSPTQIRTDGGFDSKTANDYEWCGET